MSALRILLVEDDPVDAQLAGELLREGLPGCDVSLVGTIGAAVELLRGERFGAILLDLRLPDSRGVEALRRIEAVADAPIIVLTSVVDDELAMQTVRAGADDYLVKGRLGPESLARVLRFAIQRHERSQDGSASAAEDLPVVALLGSHAVLLEGLAATLRASGSYAVLGTLPTIGALDERRGRRLDAVVVHVDDRAPPLEGLRLRLAGARVLLLADAPDRLVRTVLDDNHADGLLASTSSAAEIVEALHRLLQDQVVLPPGWRARRAHEVAPDPMAALSDRQREVLSLVATGRSNEQIAGQLHISVNTVKFHVRSAYRGLNINSRVQAAQLLAGSHAAGSG